MNPLEEHRLKALAEIVGEEEDYLEQIFEVPVDVLTLVGVEAIRNRKVSENIQESIVYV